jgi:myo-inositol-1(or 4)-monophosphatase
MKILFNLVDIINSNLEQITGLRGDYRMKSDGSYVSKGDLLVQQLVFNFLSEKLPIHEFISEEHAIIENKIWQQTGSYIIIDPIDGTENFVSGLREWGVGISIYTHGTHEESMIFMPELNDWQITGMPIKKFNSRIIGLSSSVKKKIS